MPVRAALVGGDNPHAGGWLETLRHAPSISEVGLCGEWDGQDEEFEVYPNVDALLSSGAWGMALVCTHNALAPMLAHRLLEAGVPTLVEKPVARTAREIAELNRLAERVGVPWSTCFLNRYHPAVRTMKNWVQEGAIGQLLSVEGRMVTSTVAQRNPSHWLFSHKEAGGGILHWLGVHTVDLVRFISGCEFNRVSAETATLVEHIDVEEVASAAFRLDGGAIGHIHAAYALPRRYGDISMALRGSDGDISWQSWDYAGRQERLVVQSRVGKWADQPYCEEVCNPPVGPGYGGQMGIDFVGDFIAAAQRNEPFVCSGMDALRAMQFIEGAYQSAESGQRVELICENN